MVEIDYRIVFDYEDKQQLLASSEHELNIMCSEITGFFKLSLNGHEMGYVQDWPLYFNRPGPELIFCWFDAYIRMLLLIPITRYVTFLSPDNTSLWHEFIMQDDKVAVSIVKDKDEGHRYYTDKCTRRNNFLVSNALNIHEVLWREQNISYTELASEILQKSEKFITEIASINNRFCNMLEMVALKSNIDTAQTILSYYTYSLK